MKYFITLFTFLLFLSACGTDDSPNTEPTEPINSAPSVPVPTAPLEDATWAGTDVTFNWQAATDPNGNSISYKIEVASDIAFANILKTDVTSFLSMTITLEENKSYYWRVQARNFDNELSAFSTPINFNVTEAGAPVPEQPTLIYPSNNEICTDNTLDMRWTDQTTSDISEVIYTLQIASDASFENIFVEEETNATQKTVTLDLNTTYFWRVKSANTENTSNGFSQIYEFYTQGEVVQNYLPNSPVLVAPSEQEIAGNTETRLEWEASDPDNDPLVFDVYFGIDAATTSKISTNQVATFINVDTETAATYYWKVVVKDDKGGHTLGQIWSFTSN